MGKVHGTLSRVSQGIARMGLPFLGSCGPAAPFMQRPSLGARAPANYSEKARAGQVLPRYLGPPRRCSVSPIGLGIGLGSVLRSG